jgi:TRAP-type mannitol/chloroaromatic compound transport system permease large subunit
MKLRRIEIEHVRSLRAFAWSPGDFNLVVGDGGSDLLRALALFAASAQGWSRFSELMSAEPRPHPELLREGSIETSWKVTLAPDPDGHHEFMSELVVERFHGEPGWEVVFERIARFDDFDDIELLGRRGGRCEFTLSPPKRGFASSFNAPKKKETARVAGDMTALGALPKFRADTRVSAHADAIADWALYESFDVTHGAPARKPSVERWFHGRLAEDGSNLINVLYNIHDWYAARDTFAAQFATATGIVGAVVTLMGLLALPAMLRAGYSIPMSAGAITAGGCLGILIPPSVMLIVYGATAGVSVVQLYAGAFFPGLMLAGLYIVYVILVATFLPKLAPPLSAEARRVALPAALQRLADTVSERALPALVQGLKGPKNADVPAGFLVKQLGIALLPAALFAVVAFGAYRIVTSPPDAPLQGADQRSSTPGALADPGGGVKEPPGAGGLAEPPGAGSSLSEPPGSGVKEPPGTDVKEPPGAAPASGLAEPPGAGGVKEPPGAGSAGVQEPPSPTTAAPPAAAPAAERLPVPGGYWIGLAVGAIALVAFYAVLTFQRLEIFKQLLTSFFPLVVLILSVLGSIVFGLATPTEAAAVGAFGGFVLAAAYRQLTLDVVKESVFLTAKTSAMVCWLFVGSAIFSAAFALLGGQELVEKWVLSMNLTKTQFLLLSQFIIFILGWPLEWTEIIVIFMPIFIPLLDNFGVDPLFFGLLVALNLQTAFLSPPVAMAAFYLKGVSPPHVTLNQIFAGMMPFMGIQVIAIALLYLWPQIGLWLPQVLYK